MEKIKVIVIVGPTASGKSDLAVKIAKQVDGEIISADSRQVYKGMNIGTGKITKKEMSGIKHYLLDVADPKKTFTVIDFVRLAEGAITEIINKDKTPIVVGGTGFYIQALIDGLILPDVPPNNNLRNRLKNKTLEELLLVLEKLDKDRFSNIDKQNPRRIIRAIEIATALGKVPKLKNKTKYEPVFIGIKVEPDLLKEKIHKRLLTRMKMGMLREVSKLHKQGLTWKKMEEFGLEYRYVARFLQNKITRQEMLKQLEKEIVRYAKRQMTWFGKDKRIKWLESGPTRTRTWNLGFGDRCFTIKL